VSYGWLVDVEAVQKLLRHVLQGAANRGPRRAFFSAMGWNGCF
jgi:hypothetical protein